MKTTIFDNSRDGMRGGVFVRKNRVKSTSGYLQKTDELEQLVNKSKKIIYQVESVFPFDFIPSRLVICPNRITLCYRNIWKQEEFPMLIENITGVHVYKSLFFASLYIETFGLREVPPAISKLRVDEARKARRYILALLECKKNSVDLSSYPIAVLREKLHELGMVREGVFH